MFLRRVGRLRVVVRNFRRHSVLPAVAYTISDSNFGDIEIEWDDGENAYQVRFWKPSRR